jgi:hypothetical protein
MSLQTRDLIRQMTMANPLWSARIHCELLKLGNRGQPSHGRQIPAVAAQSSLPDLA